MSDTDWQQPRSGYADYRLSRDQARYDYCEMELTVEPKHLNRLNVPHGGALATLIDTAAGIAVAFAQGPDKVLPAVTLSLSMNSWVRRKWETCYRDRQAHRRRPHGRLRHNQIKNQDARAIARGDATFRYVTPRD